MGDSDPQPRMAYNISVEKSVAQDHSLRRMPADQRRSDPEGVQAALLEARTALDPARAVLRRAGGRLPARGPERSQARDGAAVQPNLRLRF